MLYLEDFLELIEHLPGELRDRCTELRMLDLKVQSGLDQKNKAEKEYFEQEANLSKEEQERRFLKIKEEYKRVEEQQDEKVAMTEAMYTQMEKYVQKLYKEILHFKYELEADNPGITEIIEKRFCDAERSLMAQRKDRRKRSHDVNQSSTAAVSSSGSSNRMDAFSFSARSAHKASTSASATDLSHTDYPLTPHSSRTNLMHHDNESASTSSVSRLSRALVAGGERNPELPPLKKRSTMTNKLVAITNVSTSPIQTTPSAIASERFTAPLTHTVHSPASVAAKLSYQNTVTPSGSSSNLANSITPSSSMLTFAGQESRHGRPRK